MEKYKLLKNKKNTRRNFLKTSGFTLIELMVSTSIFMIIMLVAMGSLVMSSDSAKKSNALNFTMDNLSFAIESMSRSLRMGTNYYCNSEIVLSETLGTSDCSDGASNLAFMPAGEQTNIRMAYLLEERGDEKNTKTIRRCDTDTDTCVDIISPNIDVETLKFFVKGSSINDSLQPSVYMIIKGSITIKKEVTSFSIQTMISQRTSDL